MSQHKIEINEREKGAHIEITLANGKLYRFTIWDKSDDITINSVDGRIVIYPLVSNEVKITAD